VFSGKGFGNVAGYHSIDDLNLFNNFAVPNDVQTRAFDDQVILVSLNQVFDPDVRDEFSIRGKVM